MPRGKLLEAQARAVRFGAGVLGMLLPALAATQPMKWRYEYDAGGNLTEIIDPRGIATRFAYDPLNRRTLTTQPPAAPGGASPVVGVAYDGVDLAKSVTDPRALTTTYATDGLGNTTTQSSPDTGTTIQTFNAAGLIVTRKDARNVTAAYTYDALNRPTRIVYSGTGFTSLTDTFAYDQGSNAVGKLTSMTYSGGSTVWTFDGFGRVDSKTQTLGTVSFKVQKTYDVAGRVATLTYPSGKLLAIAYANGQASGVTLDGTSIASNISYTPFGAIASWTWGNATTNVRTFDLNGRMTSHPLGSDVRTIAYDDAGRISSVTHVPTAALDQAFGYDDLDRLVQANAPNATRAYAYDLTGNRTQTTTAGVLSTYTTSATSNRLTSIAGGVARSFAYDAMGNVTGDGTFTATYDARGRMKTVAVGASTTTYLYDAIGQRVKKSGGPAGTVHYVYDEDGRLLGEYDANGAATSEFVWLGDMPLAVLATTEFVKDNGASGTTFVGTWATASTPIGFYGSNYRMHVAQAASPDSVTWNLATATGTYKVYARWPANSTHSAQALFQVIHASGTANVTVNQKLDGGEWVLLGTFGLTTPNSKVTLIPQPDGLVAADAVKAVANDEANRIYFIHADHLNAPRAVMNSANQLRWRWTSDPFGLLPPDDNPSGLGVFALNLRLPGQIYDVESNLHYNYFRDYDPSAGRYAQSDRIGLAAGPNTYALAGGNPILRVDRLGLAYFAFRPLMDLYPFALLIPGLGQWQLAHENLFFEDGLWPPNLGFSEEGVGIDPFPFGYAKADGGYNDCVMRMAAAMNNWPGSEYNLLFCPNCQTWSAAVRASYNLLLHDPKVLEECGCGDTRPAARTLPFFAGKPRQTYDPVRDSFVDAPPSPGGQFGAPPPANSAFIIP
jgi:RHS repeat-associated protein